MADESWKKNADRRYKEKATSTRFKLVVGDNSVRILPRKNPNGKFGGAPFAEYATHMNVGPNERFLTCGKDERGDGKCWLCDVQIPKLQKSGKDALVLRASKIAPMPQFAVQITTVDEDGHFRAPQIWEMKSGGSRMLSTQILGVLRSTKRDYISFANGYNLNIERTGTGMKDTRYGAIIPDMEPTAVPRSVAEKMKTFEELIRKYSESEQQTAYFGREMDEPEEPAAAEEDTGYEDAVDEPAEDEPAEDDAVDEPAEDEPVEDEPTEDEPAEDEPAEDEPASDIDQEFEDLFADDPPAAKKKATAPPARKSAAPVSPAKKKATAPPPAKKRR